MIALIVFYIFIALVVLVIGIYLWDDNRGLSNHQDEVKWGARMLLLGVVWPVLLIILIPTFIEFLQKIWEDAGFAGNDED